MLDVVSKFKKIYEKRRIQHINDSFSKFIKARVRRVVDYDEPPTYKQLWTAYRRWHENQSGKRLTEPEMKICLNEMFQAPADGKTYKHLQLFDTDEDAEEFDREQAEAAAAAAATTA